LGSRGPNHQQEGVANPIPPFLGGFQQAVSLRFVEESPADTFYLSPVGYSLPLVFKVLFLNNWYLVAFYKRRFL